jgi:isochorismate synthase
VISVLHPTPAVCGLPKQEAKDFILENEGYDRKYYTGFLGELNKEAFNKETLKSDLYVNLRCMKIKDNQAHLYVVVSQKIVIQEKSGRRASTNP